MEMTRMLANDHQQTDRLLKQLQAATQSAEQQWLFRELRHELEAHTRVEEEIFYPALRDAQGSDIRIDEAVADHETIRSLLLQMEQATPESSGWVQSLEELKSKIEHHVQEEERELFPKAQSLLAPQVQDNLFERMVARKAELAGEGADSALHAQSGEADVSRTSEQAREYASRMREQGEAALEQGAGVAADRTRRVAEALHATSENLEKEDQAGLSRYLREAANGLDRFSNRLASGDIDALLREARDIAKRNPALLLGGAIAAGFLLTRFVKSTEAASTARGSDEVQAGMEPSYRVPTETSESPVPPGVSMPTGTPAQPTRPHS